MGRSRGGLTSKIHAIVDAEGHPINLCLTGGQAADYSQVEGLIERIKAGGTLLADKAYDTVGTDAQNAFKQAVEFGRAQAGLKMVALPLSSHTSWI